MPDDTGVPGPGPESPRSEHGSPRQGPGDETRAMPPVHGDGWLIGGRYRVTARLGAGAMAEVFRAHDETLDRDVAVKVFRTMLDDADASENGAARRELELRSLAQFSHPNLIALFDGSVAADGHSFLVLELVEGPNLAAVLSESTPAEAQVRVIGAQIASALAYVHERGLVHRDVKPANILLGSDGDDDPSGIRARLSDFGIARFVDSARVTSTNLTVGTAYYLAPEQARSADVGPPADVYALGLVLLEALTGARGFEGSMIEVLHARLTTAPAIPADLPAPWPGLLRAMTDFDPAARPTAAQVAAELTGAGLPTVTTPAGPVIVPIDPGVDPAANTFERLALAGAPMAVSSGRYGEGPPDLPNGARTSGSHPIPRRRRVSVGGMVAAAVLVVALIAGGGWMLARTSGGADDQGTPGPRDHTSHRAAHSTSATRHPHRRASSTPSQPSTSHTHTRTSSSSASAPSTSPSDSTSLSTSPSDTSSAPTTSSSSESSSTSSGPSTSASSSPTKTRSTSSAPPSRTRTSSSSSSSSSTSPAPTRSPSSGSSSSSAPAA